MIIAVKEKGGYMVIDYDPCDDCHERGDDYYQDNDGDWMLRCYDCPLWEFYTERSRER